MALLNWNPEIEAERRRNEREPRRIVGRPSYVLGLDLGQTTDYSALVVDEVVAGRHDIRHIRRWPLRTPYPAIVEEVAALTRRAPLTAEDTLVVDQTGVGRAVVDMIRTAALGVKLVPVTITAGNQASFTHGEWHVPKRDLIGVVSVLLQGARLRIAPALAEASTLTNELASFQMKVTLAANDVYGAWREGQHDDTVLAVAVATWYVEQCGTAGVWFA